MRFVEAGFLASMTELVISLSQEFDTLLPTQVRGWMGMLATVLFWRAVASSLSSKANESSDANPTFDFIPNHSHNLREIAANLVKARLVRT